MYVCSKGVALFMMFFYINSVLENLHRKSQGLILTSRTFMLCTHCTQLECITLICKVSSVHRCTCSLFLFCHTGMSYVHTEYSCMTRTVCLIKLFESSQTKLPCCCTIKIFWYILILIFEHIQL